MTPKRRGRPRTKDRWREVALSAFLPPLTAERLVCRRLRRVGDVAAFVVKRASLAELARSHPFVPETDLAELQSGLIRFREERGGEVLYGLPLEWLSPEIVPIQTVEADRNRMTPFERFAVRLRTVAVRLDRAIDGDLETITVETLNEVRSVLYDAADLFDQLADLTPEPKSHATLKDLPGQTKFWT